MTRSGNRALVAAIEAEYARYRAIAEGAIAQADDAGINARENAESNSIAMVCWHVSGNLASRFTDFLTTDGEKSWRRREEEFQARMVGKDELLRKWEAGWSVLASALASLADADLDREVTIRRQPLTVREALLRSLAHVAYHVGQVVYIAKAGRGASWSYLSIPPGQSDAYNRRPSMERPAEQAANVKAGG